MFTISAKITSSDKVLKPDRNKPEDIFYSMNQDLSGFLCVSVSMKMLQSSQKKQSQSQKFFFGL